MQPWFETVGVVIVAIFGIFLGMVFSRLRRPYWIVGYLLSLALIAVMVIIRCVDSLAFAPPFYWIVAGRAKFVLLALATTLGLITPLSRLPNKSEKVTVFVLMVVVLLWFSVLPFLVPAVIQSHLASLETRIGSNGVCFQTTNYTCGPAAAVTALTKLGLPAEEGEIAVLSRTSPVAGTLPLSLYTALSRRYGPEGLKCRYQRFDSVAQLKDAGITLAVVKDTLLSDHCVAVLEVSDKTVTIADPVGGKEALSYKQFEQIWRFSGIVLKRTSAQNI